MVQNALIEFSYANLQNFAADSLSVNDIIGSLPNDQWVKELERWFSVGLSHLQIGISDYAVGLAVRDPGKAAEYEMPPKERGQRRLCGMQKMRKPGGFTCVFLAYREASLVFRLLVTDIDTRNINFFALVFMLTFSVTVTLLDLLLLRFFIFMSRFRVALSPRIDRWIQDGIFQLQRRAYETHAQWRDTEEEIPVTVGNVLLPDLPLEKTTQTWTMLTPSPSFSRKKPAVVTSWPASTATEVASVRASLVPCDGGDLEFEAEGAKPPTPSADLMGRKEERR